MTNGDQKMKDKVKNGWPSLETGRSDAAKEKGIGVGGGDGGAGGWVGTSSFLRFPAADEESED